MSAIEIIEARLPNGNKLRGELVYDPDPEATNPRERDNLGTILITPKLSHWVASPDDDVIDTSIPLGNDPYEHWENIRREQLQLKKSDIAIAYPVNKYEHGCISLSLGHKSGWDYSTIGFIYATKEQVRKCYGVKRITKGILEHAENCMQSELDTLTNWLNGECYGWKITEYALDDGLDWEVGTIDSCWGYLDQAHALDDLADMIKHYTQMRGGLK